MRPCMQSSVYSSDEHHTLYPGPLHLIPTVNKEKSQNLLRDREVAGEGKSLANLNEEKTLMIEKARILVYFFF